MILLHTLAEITELILISNLAEGLSLNLEGKRKRGRASARMEGGGDGWREERPKREIVTTELVAGADFFHHLPCVAGGQQLEDWERVRVKPHPQHPATKHNASEHDYLNLK